MDNQDSLKIIESIGQTLKEKREHKGFSLGYISDITRINFRMLEDIEAGILREEPGPVFVRGFIRSYARQVGMNDQEIQEMIQSVPALQGDEQLHHMDPIKSVGDSGKISMQPFILGGIILVIVAVAYLGFATFSKQDSAPQLSEEVEEVEVITEPEQETASVPEVAPEPVPQPAIQEPVKTPEPVATVKPVETTPVQATVPESTDYLRLKISARELTWLTVTADNEKPHEILLQPGEAMEWNASENYLLNISNTKHVDVLLNSKPLKVDQKKDLLVNWTITRDMLE
ncbi:MAG: DUF4115 domain-containing protein [SAR324 cluster bacterium]|nr:DUF4115 domain-containing protein [SAR324 cluster bacterium]